MSLSCRLLAEWRSDNPPAEKEALGSHKKRGWTCPDCHYDYKATPDKRSQQHTGRPKCARAQSRPMELLINKRSDLADEYDTDRNTQLVETVRCTSKESPFWRCKRCSLSFTRQVIGRVRSNSGCPSCAREKKVGNRPISDAPSK